MMQKWIVMSALVLCQLAWAKSDTKKKLTQKPKLAVENPKVLIKTNQGDFVFELYADKAPKTVENFLRYVKEEKYDGTIFHRVVDDFVIQGGGFDSGMRKRKTWQPIPNEADNGLTNERGTIAMARTPDINSATNQFFINLKDNSFLNHRDKSKRGYGYAVFGRVVKGMPTINKIKQVEVTTKQGHENVPKHPIVIKSAKLLNPKKEKKSQQ